MTANDQELLRRAAREFRKAVEERGPFPGTFAGLRGFPKGCCKHASFLLARVLDLEFGIDESDYVWGTAKDGVQGTHGWLECRGSVVDVTADQFPGVGSRVMIVECGKSVFHDEFHIESRDSYPRFWHGMKARARVDFESTLRTLISQMQKDRPGPG